MKYVYTETHNFVNLSFRRTSAREYKPGVFFFFELWDFFVKQNK